MGEEGWKVMWNWMGMLMGLLPQEHGTPRLARVSNCHRWFPSGNGDFGCVGRFCCGEWGATTQALVRACAWSSGESFESRPVAIDPVQCSCPIHCDECRAFGPRN